MFSIEKKSTKAFKFYKIINKIFYLTSLLTYRTEILIIGWTNHNKLGKFDFYIVSSYVPAVRKLNYQFFTNLCLCKSQN